MTHKQDIASLITIRNFLLLANEGEGIVEQKSDFKLIQNKIRELNKEIVRLSLALDLTSKQVSSTSTVPVEIVMAAIRNQDKPAFPVQQNALADDLVAWQKDIGETVEDDADDVEQEGISEVSKSKSRGKIKRST